MLRAANPGNGQKHSASGDLDGDDVLAFLDLLVDGDLTDSEAWLRERHGAGMSLEDLYRRLIWPAARLSGTMWRDDEIGFVDVSLVLSRLQILNAKLSRLEEIGSAEPDRPRRIVLARAPGEQHAFGLVMVAQYFRIAGWHVAGGADLEAGAALADVVSNESYSMVGLSAGSRVRALSLQEPIEMVRRQSLNPDIEIMVGGAAFDNDPGLCTEIGADMTAGTGTEAVERAQYRIGA